MKENGNCPDPTNKECQVEACPRFGTNDRTLQCAFQIVSGFIISVDQMTDQELEMARAAVRKCSTPYLASAISGVDLPDPQESGV